MQPTATEMKILFLSWIDMAALEIDEPKCNDVAKHVIDNGRVMSAKLQ